MNGRRVKQERFTSNGLGVRPASHVKGVTCHNIFFISSAFHRQSKPEHIFFISRTVADQEVGHLRAKELQARMYDPLRLLVYLKP
jgi:hypothetical protein